MLFNCNARSTSSLSGRVLIPTILLCGATVCHAAASGKFYWKDISEKPRTLSEFNVENATCKLEGQNIRLEFERAQAQSNAKVDKQSLALDLIAGIVTGGVSSPSEQENAHITNCMLSKGFMRLPYPQSGYSTITFVSGEIYEGEFKQGDFAGKGKLTLANGGAIFEGEFKQGNFTGKGKLTQVNGNVIEGEFKSYKVNGVAKLTTKDGQTYDGVWKDNELITGTYSSVAMVCTGHFEHLELIGTYTCDHLPEKYIIKRVSTRLSLQDKFPPFTEFYTDGSQYELPLTVYTNKLRFGFKYDVFPGYLLITDVVKDSAAYDAGVAINDKITKINGTAIGELKIADIRKFLSDTQFSSMTLELNSARTVTIARKLIP
jgi:hypothetical protein